jgi:galactose oxidase
MNHFSMQIFTPPYLFNADNSPATRPVINSVSANSVAVGNTLTVTTNGAISSFALIRIGSATHTVDTDQRRIPLTPLQTDVNTYSIRVPADPGGALPGYWMLFALNSAGVPSLASTIQITLPTN